MTTETFQPDQKLSATLEAQEWNVVFAGLGELPSKVSMKVINKLTQQLVTVPPTPAPNGNGIVINRQADEHPNKNGA